MRRLRRNLAVLLVLGVLSLIVVVTTVLVDDDALCGPWASPASSKADGGVPDGEFSVPEPGESWPDKKTSGFGMRWGSMHNGVDIASGAGTPIYAFADGVVADAGEAQGFGSWIVIDHDGYGEFFSTVYGHIFPEDLLVSTGDTVKAGQHIANEGYNGSVQPPGPGGSHLHFEVWPGGRLSGGSPVDPEPWINKAVAPGSTETKQGTPKNKTASNRANKPQREETAGELTPVPEVFNEAHMQVDSVRIGRAVAHKFPEITTIGGWRPSDPFPDHPSGRAVDIMIDNWDTDEGKQLGDEVLAYLYGNREYFQIEYFIWRQKYIPAEGEGNMMEDRGSPTQNHFDHVHVTTKGHGFPEEGQSIGEAPDGGDSTPTYRSDCVSTAEDVADVDADLGGKGIPPGIERMIPIAARECSAVNEALLAGLMDHESMNFTPQAVSPVGAQGWAQFMPDTWKTYGAEVDDNTGEVIGPPGSGSPHDEEDATIAAGKFLCHLDEELAPARESGQIKGDPEELILAAYNAGPGAVIAHGGVPPYSETQNYVKVVPETARKYEQHGKN